MVGMTLEERIRVCVVRALIQGWDEDQVSDFAEVCRQDNNFDHCSIWLSMLRDETEEHAT